MANGNRNEDFLTTAGAAAELGLGVDRIRQLAKANVLPSISTAGGFRVFRRADVERLKRERQKKSAAA